MLLSTRLGRLILGENWSPLRAEVQHAAQGDYRIHRQLFRCPLEYGAERSAVVVSRDDIRRPTPHGTAHLLAFLEQHLESVRRAMPVDFVGQVAQMITTTLASGWASIARIAMLIPVSSRTLQRSLTHKGTHLRGGREA